MIKHLGVTWNDAGSDPDRRDSLRSISYKILIDFNVSFIYYQTIFNRFNLNTETI